VELSRLTDGGCRHIDTYVRVVAGLSPAIPSVFAQCFRRRDPPASGFNEPGAHLRPQQRKEGAAFPIRIALSFHIAGWLVAFERCNRERDQGRLLARIRGHLLSRRSFCRTRSFAFCA
jgi:hypothetical protein